MRFYEVGTGRLCLSQRGHRSLVSTVAFSPDGRWFDMLIAIGSFAAGAALLVYERYFLKKLKNISYL